MSHADSILAILASHQARREARRRRRAPFDRLVSDMARSEDLMAQSATLLSRAVDLVRRASAAGDR